MTEFILSLGSSALENFWPVLIWWTLPASLIYLIIWKIKGGRPLLATRLSSGLMISLPLYFFAGLIPVPEIAIISPAFQLTLPAISVSATQPAVQVFSVANLVSGILLTLVFGVAFVSFIRLGYKYFLWFRFKSHFRLVESGKVYDLIQNIADDLGISRPIRLFTHDFSTSPFTFGLRRPAVVLPLTVMCQTALQKPVIVHELMHIKRYDDLFGRIEQFVYALAGWHPIISMLNKIILLNREVACDNATLTVSKIDKQQYACLLVNLLPTSVNEAQSLCPGMAELKTNLSRRIIAMKNIIKTENNTYLITALMLALLLGLSACTETTPVVDTARESQTSTKADEVQAIAAKMPEIVGGYDALINQISYPQIAKSADIEGRVVVQLVVDQSGHPTELRTMGEPIGYGLEEEAMRAVSEIMFSAGEDENGEKVSVRISLPISFRLR